MPSSPAVAGKEALAIYISKGLRPAPKEDQGARSIVKKSGNAVLKGVMGDARAEENVFGRCWHLVVNDEFLQIEVPGIINDTELLKEAVELVLTMADMLYQTKNGERTD